ncbi:hypothetical protein OF829_09170 [Sphingomonas sp. LB-2]|uniref:hypothetical protein n=1 Tax=Sphingomonas caeni TaxID=2984949 RepID=UPI00222F358D|nr:hypothetical protein [Sphingomonas caeni]MCW3847412.1 hypothetical protein [Sphingomonas caeni]
MEIEGVTLAALRALPPGEQDALLAFGRPITFRMGTVTILAEFNRADRALEVNLAHIGGEGVLVALWKAITAYAAERDYSAIIWNVHALTCANPNPRLQRFLRARGFAEADHPVHGRILTLEHALGSSPRPPHLPSRAAGGRRAER